MAVEQRKGDALIEACRTGDSRAVRELAPTPEDLAARDEHGWSPLDWAAGGGDPVTTSVLLDAGADPTAVTGDGRTPYEIALAAGRREVAGMLREHAGQQPGGWAPYCRAYPLSALRAYRGWPSEAEKSARGGPPDGEAIGYVHDDFTVTTSMWPGEDVLLAEVTPEWKRFCSRELGFAVPDDLDLIPAASGRTDEREAR
ncbi:ankyrin repeat domain-containing protein [Actinosynnema mirum]|uniref:Ankyrin n=1 Tax=Actinosynnema mirum (strain ATCC 29888 / DSM 43827 / JCM 3225 / NBRC 14064 / NCIMB 13271 / NRRL B-12336 / IMRU 3971 / 101) TaxID=446462 RepID=C6WBY3_ACTMD|nr:ankyrin repeat domain-containing protein [Actinosynnema mirum]ACU37550.1 Ankyrin [Actinosynnema mirum DSM 43827]